MSIEQDLKDISRVEGALEFRRDFYLCTSAEMRERWLVGASDVLPHVIDGLGARMRRAVEKEFEGHNPLWEYTRAFVYWGREFDPIEQKNVSKAVFYLHKPLHKDLVQDPILEYLTEPTPPNIRGFAVFMMREGLKTYACIVAPTSWLLTRHRVIFKDWTQVRIIHDVEEEAVKRSQWVKDLHVNCEPLRGLYPEVAIDSLNWMKMDSWDLKDRKGRSLDPQVSASGARSVRQGTHYPYTLLDDLEGDRHVASPASRAETERFFELLKYSGKGRASKTLLVGTFYSPFSVHATIVDMAREEDAEGKPRKPSWKMVHLPAILNEGKHTERAIYPTQKPLEVLRAMSEQEIEATGDDLNFRMQMMLDFKAQSKFSFEMDRWQELDLEYPEGPLAVDLVASLPSSPTFSFGDYAGKDDKTRGRGDDNAIVIEKLVKVDGRVYTVIMDMYVDNVSTVDEIAARQLDMSMDWGCSHVFAEENPSHRWIGQTLDRVSKARGYGYYQRLDHRGRPMGNIITMVPKGRTEVSIGAISSWKMGRMRKFQGKWNNGMVWIASSVPEECRPLFKRTLSTFPFCKPDDTLDAASQSEDAEAAAYMPRAHVHAPAQMRRERARQVPVEVSRYTGLYLPQQPRWRRRY